MTQQQLDFYKLVDRDGWVYSSQGLVYIEGMYEEEYLSRVFKLNEIDEKFNKIKQYLENDKRI